MSSPLATNLPYFFREHQIVDDRSRLIVDLKVGIQTSSEFNDRTLPHSSNTLIEDGIERTIDTQILLAAARILHQIREWTCGALTFTLEPFGSSEYCCLLLNHKFKNRQAVKQLVKLLAPCKIQRRKRERDLPDDPVEEKLAKNSL